MEVAGIRAAGRSTQGVKLINLGAGDTIGSIEHLARIEDAEEAGKTPTSVSAAPVGAESAESPESE